MKKLGVGYDLSWGGVQVARYLATSPLHITLHISGHTSMAAYSLVLTNVPLVPLVPPSASMATLLTYVPLGHPC